MHDRFKHFFSEYSDRYSKTKLVIKSAIYRVYSLVIDFIVVYAFSGSFKLGAQIAVTVNVIKIFSYLAFEHLWLSKRDLARRVFGDRV